MNKKNYLERLRFSMVVEDQTIRGRITPTISIGLESMDKHDFILDPKQSFNTFTFDETISSPGTQKLQLHIKELENDSYKIGAVKIIDLRIHGISIHNRLYQSTYYPYYDAEHSKDTPTAPTELKSVLLLGNRGTWEFTFETPVHEHETWRIGLV